MADHETIRVPLYLRRDLLQRCDGLTKSEGYKSRNDFLQHAIQFYASYLMANRDQSYLCETVGQIVRGSIRLTEDRLASLLFKHAVELAKLNRLIGPLCNFSDAELKSLHVDCVDEVRELGGTIPLDRAVREAR